MKFSSRFDREAHSRRRWLRGRELSLRGWLTAFALFVCLAIIALFALDTLHAREVAVGVARVAAENLADSFEQQASDRFEAVDGALRAIAERVEQNGTGPAARDRLRESMAFLGTTLPRVHGLLIVDERGRSVVTNAAWATRPDLRLGGQPYFRYHRSHAGSSVYFSGPERGYAQSDWVIFVTRRLNHRDGSFAGVAVARIALDTFEQIFASVDVGRFGVTNLIAADGTLLVRRPRAFIGGSLRNTVLFVHPFKSLSAGSYIRSSRVDGVLRLYAFRRLDRYPLVVEVALAQSDYLAEWRSHVRASLIALGFVVTLIGALAGGLSAQIDRRKRAEETLARLALLDGLTGIANRRHFDAVLEREWRSAAREQTPLALLMIDVDNFKGYNDRYGHQLGDDVLISIARTIAAGIVRPGDLAARYGGEEFAAVLPATDASQAVTVAERIRGAVVELGVAHAGAPTAIVSVSIGVASVVPTRLTERSTLVKAADRALYDAKRAGRDRISVMWDVPPPVAPDSAIRAVSPRAGTATFRSPRK